MDEVSGEARGTAAKVRAAVVRMVWFLWPRPPFVVDRWRIRRRVAKACADPDALAGARREMEHLLGPGHDPDDLDRLARGYLEHWLAFEQTRWHPRRVTRQRVEGIEHLRAARAEGRGVLVSFAHHGQFDGVFPSVGRAGVPVRVVISEESWRHAGPKFLQHLRVVGSHGAGLLSTRGGTRALTEALSSGAVVGAAIDVPGGTRASMLGRPVRCASGSVRAAVTLGSPVVVLTSHRGPDGPFVRLSPPLRGEDFEDVAAFVAELVHRQEPALEAWPEAAYVPTITWTSAEQPTV